MTYRTGCPSYLGAPPTLPVTQVPDSGSRNVSTPTGPCQGTPPTRGIDQGQGTVGLTGVVVVTKDSGVGTECRRVRLRSVPVICPTNTIGARLGRRLQTWRSLPRVDERRRRRDSRTRSGDDEGGGLMGRVDRNQHTRTPGTPDHGTQTPPRDSPHPTR